MIEKIKTMYLKWRDEQDLKDIQKLIKRVFRNEPIGGVVEVAGKEYVVEDIVLSMRKNQITSRRTLLKNYATRRQRGAMREAMEKMKRTVLIDG